jgi:hypothetical protein
MNDVMEQQGDAASSPTTADATTCPHCLIAIVDDAIATFAEIRRLLVDCLPDETGTAPHPALAPPGSPVPRRS